MIKKQPTKVNIKNPKKNNYNEQCTQYLLWLFEFKMVFDKLNNAFVHLNVAFRSYDIISQTSILIIINFFGMNYN